MKSALKSHRSYKLLKICKIYQWILELFLLRYVESFDNMLTSKLCKPNKSCESLASKHCRIGWFGESDNKYCFLAETFKALGNGLNNGPMFGSSKFRGRTKFFSPDCAHFCPRLHVVVSIHGRLLVSTATRKSSKTERKGTASKWPRFYLRKFHSLTNPFRRSRNGSITVTTLLLNRSFRKSNC